MNKKKTGTLSDAGFHRRSSRFYNMVIAIGSLHAPVMEVFLLTLKKINGCKLEVEIILFVIISKEMIFSIF